MSRKRAGLLLATVCTLAAGADAEARQTKVGPSVKGPVAGSPTKPDQDEVVEITQAAPAADEAAHPGQVDLSVKQKLEELEQKNEDLQSKLKDLERRLEIVANPPTSVSLRGYIDVGFFGFFRGNGSGITTYLPNPASEYANRFTNKSDRDSAYFNDARVQRFPEFFAPCGWAGDNTPTPCPSAPSNGLTQARWHFLGDPLATAINTAGHPADTHAQNNPAQSSLAVPYDYIQSAGRPTFLINELNLMPTARLDERGRFSALASINFYPRSASVSIGDKADGGSVQAAGPTRVGDYVWVDMAYLEYAQSFREGRHNLSIFAGRFDPNIGIEYRVRKSPERFGVTPSLICRYSCGTPIGLKARATLYDELVSVALAVHNGASYQEIFRFAENTDKKYMKTISGRLSLHCNGKNHCKKADVELGVSGEFGGQVDGFYDVGRGEFDPFVKQWTVDVDLHVIYRDLELRAEYLKTEAEGFIGSASKNPLPHLSAQGFYAEASYRILNWLGVMVRGDLRDASHIDYSVPFAYVSQMWRLTGGLRFDINNNVIFKAEYLHLQPFGRMKEGLVDNAAVGPMTNLLGGSTAAGDFAADWMTASLVLRY
ncbi:MAG: hypothetical protein U1A78_27960 [Polyangia bacterium]